MGKIVAVLLCLILILWGIPQTTLAANPPTDCQFTYYDAPDLKKEITPNQNMGDLTIRITSNIINSQTYRVREVSPKNLTRDVLIDFKTGEASIVTFNKYIAAGWVPGQYTLLLGAKDGEITSNNAICKTEFTILQQPPQACVSSIQDSPNLYPNTIVILKIEGIPQNDCSIFNIGGYDIWVNNKLQHVSFCTNNGNTTQNLGTFPAGGPYTVEVKSKCLAGAVECNRQLMCNPTQFTVKKLGDTPSSEVICNISPDVNKQPITTLNDIYIIASNLTPKTKFNIWGHKQSDPNIYSLGDVISNAYGSLSFLLHNPSGSKTPTPADNYESRIYAGESLICSKPYTVRDASQVGQLPPQSIKKCGEMDENGKKIICASAGGLDCPGETKTKPAIKTAIGCIHTNPADLIADVLKFALGIGGGLAFLMMLLGAFQMLTSAGNPDTLAAGKDRLTSAVIGLLFVIFAVLLLQIIGVDILGIPGFGR